MTPLTTEEIDKALELIGRLAKEKEELHKMFGVEAQTALKMCQERDAAREALNAALQRFNNLQIERDDLQEQCNVALTKIETILFDKEKDIEELRISCSEIAQLRARIKTLEFDNAHLERERDQFRAHATILQDENAKLEKDKELAKAGILQELQRLTLKDSTIRQLRATIDLLTEWQTPPDFKEEMEQLRAKVSGLGMEVKRLCAHREALEQGREQLQATIKKLEEENSTLTKASSDLVRQFRNVETLEWIPISTPPTEADGNERGHILCRDLAGCTFSVGWENVEAPKYGVTHWCRIPVLPKQGTKDEFEEWWMKPKPQDEGFAKDLCKAAWEAAKAQTATSSPSCP